MSGSNIRRSGGAWQASPRLKRRVALGAAGALIAGGVLAAPTASYAAGSCSVNPMGGATPLGSTEGYTIFTTGDAVFANSETEGTLAVGGTARFWDEEGNPNPQYRISHKTAGSAGYSLPVIDGSPNRVLFNAYDPGIQNPANTSLGKVVQVTDDGRPASVAGPGLAKLVQVDQPDGYRFRKAFGGSGTTFYPSGGTNQSAQLESKVQAWQGSGDQDPAGTAAAVASFQTEGSFSSYFPAEEGAIALRHVSSWRTPQISHGGETVISLDPSGPNRISFSQLGTAAKFQFAPGTTLSACAPLVIEVTSDDLTEGRLVMPSFGQAGNTAGGEGISYILWDLSGLGGTIQVTSRGEPVRGAIYAPFAHIVFPPEDQGGREFEGQLLAERFTALNGGKEIHTNLFKGLLPTGADMAPQPTPTPTPTAEPTPTPTPTAEPSLTPTPTPQPSVTPTPEPTPTPTPELTPTPTPDPTVTPAPTPSDEPSLPTAVLGDSDVSGEGDRVAQDTLAFTGSNSLALAGLAAGLIGVGSLLLVALRRRSA